MAGEDIAIRNARRAQNDVAQLQAIRAQVQAWIDQCTCPGCGVVWQHHWSKPWIREHFGRMAGPITCAECGTVSHSGTHAGVRQIPTTVPEPAPSARPRPSFWQRMAAPKPPKPRPPVVRLAGPPSEEPTLPMKGATVDARSDTTPALSHSQTDSPQL